MNNNKAITTVTVEPWGVREEIEKILSAVTEVRFLTDLTDQALQLATLAESKYLLTMMPLREVPEEAWKFAGNWEFVQFMSAGVDQMDFSRLPQTVTAANNGGAYDEPMAEHVLAMALCLCKKLLPNHHLLQQGEFDQFALTGTLKGKICAVLGLGGIGAASARLFRLMGMRIHAINSSGKTDQEVDFIGTLNDLEEVMRKADVLLITLPNTQSTENLLNKERFGWLKPSAMIINVARGSLVDEEALYHFLKDNPESSAGIDAWWKEPFMHGQFSLKFPILDLPNVLGSPHNSSQVPGAMQRSIQRAASNLARYIQGQEVTGVLHWDDNGVL